MTDELGEVEARIADQLAQFTSTAGLARRMPGPYVRRHAVEHAAAGGVLDERFVNRAFLPFVDGERLRSLPPGSWAGREAGARLLAVWRQVAYLASWDDPEQNQAVLSYWGGVQGLDPANVPDRPVCVRWIRRPRTTGEILCRGAGSAVATATLPDGRTIAVTGSRDCTVRLWDLLRGEPVGVPLRVFADVSCVAAVSAGDVLRVCLGGPGTALVGFRSPKQQN